MNALMNLWMCISDLCSRKKFQHHKLRQDVCVYSPGSPSQNRTYDKWREEFDRGGLEDRKLILLLITFLFFT